MWWSISKEVDGVITDDPKKFLEVCGEWERGGKRDVRIGWRVWLQVLWIWVLVAVFGTVFWWRYGRGGGGGGGGKMGKGGFMGKEVVDAPREVERVLGEGGEEGEDGYRD